MKEILHGMLTWGPWVFIGVLFATVSVAIPIICIKKPYNFMVGALGGVAGYFAFHFIYENYHISFDTFFSTYVTDMLLTDIFIKETQPVLAMLVLFPIYMVGYKVLEQIICKPISLLTSSYATLFFNILRIPLLLCFVAPILQGAHLKANTAYLVAPVAFAVACFFLDPLSLFLVAISVFTLGISILLAIIAVFAPRRDDN